MQYKSKMADEADLRRRLASLEESVELHENMKRQVIHCVGHYLPSFSSILPFSLCFSSFFCPHWCSSNQKLTV